MCHIDDCSLPSYVPTEQHSTLSVINSKNFCVPITMCDFSHSHTSPNCSHTHSTHRGHYRAYHTKIQKIAAASTAAGRGSTGCILVHKKCHLQHKEWRGAQLGCVAQERRGGSTCGGGQALVGAQGRTSLAPCGGEKNAKKWWIAAIFRCETVTRIRHPPFSVANGVHTHLFIQ